MDLAGEHPELEHFIIFMASTACLYSARASAAE
jgi:hypothetical protein